jgi:hypothetical protein
MLTSLRSGVLRPSLPPRHPRSLCSAPTRFLRRACNRRGRGGWRWVSTRGSPPRRMECALRPCLTAATALPLQEQRKRGLGGGLKRGDLRSTPPAGTLTAAQRGRSLRGSGLYRIAARPSLDLRIQLGPGQLASSSEQPHPTPLAPVAVAPQQQQVLTRTRTGLGSGQCMPPPRSSASSSPLAVYAAVD